MADGLLSEAEVRETAQHLRGTYEAQVRALGVDPASLPFVDEDDEEEEEEEDEGGGQARVPPSFPTRGAQAHSHCSGTAAALPVSPLWAAASPHRRTAQCSHA